MYLTGKSILAAVACYCCVDNPTVLSATTGPQLRIITGSVCTLHANQVQANTFPAPGCHNTKNGCTWLDQLNGTLEGGWWGKRGLTVLVVSPRQKFRLEEDKRQSVIPGTFHADRPRDPRGNNCSNRDIAPVATSRCWYKGDAARTHFQISSNCPSRVIGSLVNDSLKVPSHLIGYFCDCQLIPLFEMEMA